MRGVQQALWDTTSPPHQTRRAQITGQPLGMARATVVSLMRSVLSSAVQGTPALHGRTRRHAFSAMGGRWVQRWLHGEGA